MAPGQIMAFHTVTPVALAAGVDSWPAAGQCGPNARVSE